MKTLLELLLKLGWDVPPWVFTILFIAVALGILCVFIQKSVIPSIVKGIKLKEEIESIEEIKTKQNEIMHDSAENDKALEGEIEELRQDVTSLHTKVDQISESLQKLCSKEEQEGMSRAQNRLLEMYKKYGLNNESKTWGRYEKEVFFNTLESYTSHGGNSFIVNEVVPVMRMLNVVDD